MSDRYAYPRELHGYGRVDWPTARELLHGCACTWSDLDGVRLTEEAPAELPVGSTHLWGWSAERLLRVRFDAGPLDGGAGAYVAALGARIDGRTPVLAEPVTYQARKVRLRPEDDARSGELPAAVRDHRWEVYEVWGVSPVTFLRARG